MFLNMKSFRIPWLIQADVVHWDSTWVLIYLQEPRSHFQMCASKYSFIPVCSSGIISFPFPVSYKNSQRVCRKGWEKKNKLCWFKLARIGSMESLVEEKEGCRLWEDIRRKRQRSLGHLIRVICETPMVVLYKDWQYKTQY